MSISGIVGRKNAVVYPTQIGNRQVTILRYHRDVTDKTLHYDPNNPRLRSKLRQQNMRATPENIRKLLSDECDDLRTSLPVTKSFHEPILIDHKGKAIEGNRRLLTQREMYQDTKDETYRYILVEEVDESVTEAELRTYLAIRHVAGPRPWESREQWAVIAQMEKDGAYSREDIANLLNVKVSYLDAAQRASALYNEFDEFASKQSDEAKCKIDKLWTYFWKMASKPKFVSEVLCHPSERAEIFRYMYNGQFNDCLNCDRISQIWENTGAKKALVDGQSFREAYRCIDKLNRGRRTENLMPAAKKVASGLKKMVKGDIKRLSLTEGSDDRKILELLRIQIERVLTEAGPVKKTEALLDAGAYKRAT